MLSVTMATFFVGAPPWCYRLCRLFGIGVRRFPVSPRYFPATSEVSFQQGRDEENSPHNQNQPQESGRVEPAGRIIDHQSQR